MGFFTYGVCYWRHVSLPGPFSNSTKTELVDRGLGGQDSLNIVFDVIKCIE